MKSPTLFPTITKLKHSNYILLGIGISYLVLAFIQWRASGLLPMSVYIAIAFVSMSLTLLESVMTVVEIALTSQSRMLNIIQEETALCDRQIAVYSKFDELESLIDERQEYKKKLLNSEKKIESDRRIKRMVIVKNVVFLVEIVVICITLLVIPLQKIPNDLSSNKMLNILSLLSFALLFFSFFIKNEFSGEYSSENDLRVSNTVSNYYLDIMDKVSPREDDK